jgi:hypothetical protein
MSAAVNFQGLDQAAARGLASVTSPRRLQARRNLRDPINSRIPQADPTKVDT